MTRLRLRKRNTGVLAFFLLAVMMLMFVSPMMVHAGEFDNARDFYNINGRMLFITMVTFTTQRKGLRKCFSNTIHWRTLGLDGG